MRIKPIDPNQQYPEETVLSYKIPTSEPNQKYSDLSINLDNVTKEFVEDLLVNLSESTSKLHVEIDNRVQEIEKLGQENKKLTQEIEKYRIEKYRLENAKLLQNSELTTRTVTFNVAGHRDWCEANKSLINKVTPNVTLTLENETLTAKGHQADIETMSKIFYALIENEKLRQKNINPITTKYEFRKEFITKEEFVRWFDENKVYLEEQYAVKLSLLEDGKLQMKGCKVNTIDLKRDLDTLITSHRRIRGNDSCLEFTKNFLATKSERPLLKIFTGKFDEISCFDEIHFTGFNKDVNNEVKEFLRYEKAFSKAIKINVNFDAKAFPPEWCKKNKVYLHQKKEYLYVNSLSEFDLDCAVRKIEDQMEGKKTLTSFMNSFSKFLFNNIDQKQFINSVAMNFQKATVTLKDCVISVRNVDQNEGKAILKEFDQLCQTTLTNCPTARINCTEEFMHMFTRGDGNKIRKQIEQNNIEIRGLHSGSCKVVATANCNNTKIELYIGEISSIYSDSIRVKGSDHQIHEHYNLIICAHDLDTLSQEKKSFGETISLMNLYPSKIREEILEKVALSNPGEVFLMECETEYKAGNEIKKHRKMILHCVYSSEHLNMRCLVKNIFEYALISENCWSISFPPIGGQFNQQNLNRLTREIKAYLDDNREASQIKNINLITTSRETCEGWDWEKQNDAPKGWAKAVCDIMDGRTQQPIDMRNETRWNEQHIIIPSKNAWYIRIEDSVALLDELTQNHIQYHQQIQGKDKPIRFPLSMNNFKEGKNVEVEFDSTNTSLFVCLSKEEAKKLTIVECPEYLKTPRFEPNTLYFDVIGKDALKAMEAINTLQIKFEAEQKK